MKIHGEIPGNLALGWEISRVAPQKFGVRAGNFPGKFPGYPPAASRFPGSQPGNSGEFPVKLVPRAGKIAGLGFFPLFRSLMAPKAYYAE